jgi:catechol 2,3-dioxygenase-like lactoylglutathione lyase family enzyme
MTETAKGPQATGVHHIAVMAADIKKHIAFFSEVIGAPLVALFDMHGVPGALHAFMRLDDGCYFSIVQMPEAANIPIELGKTHAGRGEKPSAPGTMQHLAFGVKDEAALLAMRDRIRSHGVNVIGPLDHGFCQSIYFAGPDNMALEVAASRMKVDPDRWVDPAVLAKCGIDEDEARRFREPAPFVGQSPLPQPPVDETKPHMPYPREVYLKMLSVPDEIISRPSPFAQPPVPAKEPA